MQVAVLGLGRFGAHLAQTLYDQGHDVLAIDMDDGAVNDLSDKVTDARIADITDVDALDALSLGDVDVAVVATADLEASVLATMNLQQLKVGSIYAKARSDRHARILQLIGARRVMRPERDGAERFAHMIAVAAAVDFLPLTSAFGIAIFAPPARWVTQPLANAVELAAPRRLLALVRGDEVQLNPVLDQQVRAGDQLVFAATDRELGAPLSH